MKKIIIAIDGYAGCGKSTLARQLALKLGYTFLDTGAMYRAITLYLLNNHINWHDEQALSNVFSQVKIHIATDQNGRTQTRLNGVLVEEEIRSMAVSNKVSEVAAVSSIRRFLVAQQQQIGSEGGVVMDGRDIGTVVFPHAELKLFITASMEVRVARRLAELQAVGAHVSADDIRRNLEKRDLEETTRSDSPLRQAADAILIDNSDLTPEAQLQLALDFARKRINPTPKA
ncbi:MAG TPA: (d)CMP kinase [Chitinophagales bacterium]|nr:(d)CMP kinase [Chitinophagales bacterium]